MTLRNFGDAYRDAVDELPKYHMDAEKVRDELHHRRMVNARMHRKLVSAAAAVCVFLICGAGTAAAVNYHSSVIKVKNGGFSFTGGENVQILSEDQDEGVCPADGGLPQMQAAAGDPEEAGGESEFEEAPVELEAVIMEPVEYTSIEEFLQQENVAIAIPGQKLLGGGGEERVTVFESGARVFVSVRFDEKQFTMSQADNRGSQGYASSSVFSGDARNERSFVNEQGMSYTVFDSVEDGELTATHAAISINGRDVTLDFWGFDQETVEDVLYRLDLSVYFTEP